MSVQLRRVEIALNKLVPWEGHSQDGPGGGALRGGSVDRGARLMNPLTVREAGKGRFAVVEGERVVTELSLAEDLVRVAMHPADQFEAWRGQIDRGRDAAEIAVRFGVPASTVRKRLALGRVSPVILDA